LKAGIAADKERIKQPIASLDAEKSTMQDLLKQAKGESLNFAAAWNGWNVNQKQELARGLFPSGIAFSTKFGFLNHSDEIITSLYLKTLQDFEAGKLPESIIGVPDGI
jgi:hypothetical protein